VNLSGKRQAPPVLEKKSSPAIIPKHERRPLPEEYRTPNNFRDQDDEYADTREAKESSAVNPSSSISFNEFRKPIVSRTQRPVASKEDDESALNNPDYFNPDMKKLTSLASDDDSSGGSDDEYFSGNDQVQVRSSIDSLENPTNSSALVPKNTKQAPPSVLFKASEPTPHTTSPAHMTRLSSTMSPAPMTIPSKATRPKKPTSISKAQPKQTTTTTTTPASSTTKTTTPAPTTTFQSTPATDTPKMNLNISTTTPKQTEDENEVQPLIAFQRQPREDEEGLSGFIANQSENVGYSPAKLKRDRIIHKFYFIHFILLCRNRRIWQIGNKLNHRPRLPILDIRAEARILLHPKLIPQYQQPRHHFMFQRQTNQNCLTSCPRSFNLNMAPQVTRICLRRRSTVVTLRHCHITLAIHILLHYNLFSNRLHSIIFHLGDSVSLEQHRHRASLSCTRLCQNWSIPSFHSKSLRIPQ